MKIRIEKIGKLVILLTALLLAALAAYSGPFDTKGERDIKAKGKNNDAWYANNKDKIKVKLGSASYSTNGTNIRFKGTIENLSADKISAIVIDVIVVNNENKQEALRERMMIMTPAFKSETYNLPQVWTCGNDSDLAKCLTRIKDTSWSYEVVTVIGNKGGENDDWSDLTYWADNYYKVRSDWKTSDK